MSSASYAAYGGGEGAESPRYVKKKIKAGELSLDLEDNVIIVNYEVEATVLSDFGDEIRKDRKKHAKRITITRLDVNTNVPKLTEEILDKCPLIPRNKFDQVEHLLYRLQQRVVSEAMRAPSERQLRRAKRHDEKKRKAKQKSDDDGSLLVSGGASIGSFSGSDYGGSVTGAGSRRGSNSSAFSGAGGLDYSAAHLQTGGGWGAVESKDQQMEEQASIDKLEEYLEVFYEDDKLPEKLKSSVMILRLAKNAGNLETIVQNEQLMNMLTRILGEDYKKHSDLIINILYVFFAVSDFSQMHRFCQVGSKTMKVIRFELKRLELRQQEMDEMEAVYARSKTNKMLTNTGDNDILGGEAKGVDNNARDDFRRRQSRQAEASRRQQDTPAWATGEGESVDKGLHGFGIDGEEDGTEAGEEKQTNGKVEEKKKAGALVATSSNSAIGKNGESVNIVSERAKTAAILKKQERLFFVGVHLLLNLAEDVNTEQLMVKKGVLDYLVKMLDRNNLELVLVAVVFLKKVSVFEDNKDRLAGLRVVEKLAKHVPSDNEKLLQAVLRLLYNLSFDELHREQMVKHSMIPKLVDLLKKPSCRAITIRILYHLSMLDRCKSMFTYTEAIPYAMQLLINFPQNLIAKELAALAINLSTNARNAELMVKANGLKGLVERMCRTQDPLLAKVVRNIANWTFKVQEDLTPDGSYRQRILWPAFVDSLVRLVKGADTPDVLVEVLGILANLTPLDLIKDTSYADVMINHGLIEFLQKHLVPGFSQDDIVLQVVMFIGTMCRDENAARLISKSPIIRQLYELLVERQDDSDMTLQVLYTLYQMLGHNGTANEVIYETRMPIAVCEMLNHKNHVVVAMAEGVLDLICEHDEAAERGHLEKHHFEEERQGEVLMGHVSRTIRDARFLQHNKNWIDITMQDDQEESYYDGNSKDDSNFFDDSQSSFDPRSPDAMGISPTGRRAGSFYGSGVGISSSGMNVKHRQDWMNVGGEDDDDDDDSGDDRRADRWEDDNQSIDGDYVC